MRIISGIYGGRIIQSPKKHSTHPMSEKVRGAIFNALGDISGLTVLDAYAGSGAIGIEALSHGVKFVLFTDKDKQAFGVIEQNLKSLNINQQNYKLALANCVSYINNQPQEFDIIIADPPYNVVKTSQLEQLSRYVKSGGILIVSLPPNINNLEFNNFKLVRNKSYGDATLYFYRKI